MATILNGASEALVVVGETGGRTLIPTGTPLTRLNYFDGKFLRADDLRAEQDYLRALVHLSNQAGGRGVVHGLDVSVDAGDRLRLSPGMAVDGLGRLLLLPSRADVGVAELLEASRRASPGVRARVGAAGHVSFEPCAPEPATDPGAALPAAGLYLVLLAHVEALCGHEDVYGRLCEDACSRSGDRPYRLEGVVLRALPLALGAPLPTSSAVSLDERHLRSRVASAYYADARRDPSSLVSRAGLASEAWCRGAEAPDPGDVALGVLARRGGATLFLDAWTARRERMETPPRRYWYHRMAMRPWNLFLAEVLQFQCQLRDALEGGPAGGGQDPCADEHEALSEAARFVRALRDAAGPGDAGMNLAFTESAVGEAEAAFELERLVRLDRRIGDLLARTLREADRILVRRGIVELPAAGYLPVDPEAPEPVDRQVRALLGEGVDLRFCTVRPDFVAHALEEAQHMDRISLLQGLDDPTDRPEVDVLVPDGRILAVEQDVAGLYDLRVAITPPADDDGENLVLRLRGALRAEASGGGGAVRLAVSPVDLPDEAARGLLEMMGGFFEEERAEEAPGSETGEVPVGAAPLSHERDAAPVVGVRLEGRRTRFQIDAGARASLSVERDPFRLQPGDSVAVRAEAALAVAAGGRAATLELTLDGRVRLASVGGAGTETRILRGRLPRLRVVLTPVLDGEVHEIQSDTVELEVEAELTPGAAGSFSGELTLTFEDDARVVLALDATRGRVDGTLEAEWTEGGDDTSRIEVAPAEDEAISGRVVDAATGDVLAGAQVTLVGTSIATTTDASGAFRITGFPEGPAEIRATLVGYEPASASVDLDVVGASLEVILAEEAGGEPRSWDLATGTALPDAGVASAGHAAHVAAVRALDLVGRGLRDAGYREEAERALFASPEAREGGTVVRGPHGWVLFHRRRTKDCDRTQAPVGLPERSYRVLHAELGEQVDLAALREALAAGDGGLLEAMEVHALTTVRFEGGLPHLASPASTLHTAWTEAGAGDLVYGAIAPASMEGEEGPGLARDRLRRLEAIVDPDDEHRPVLEALAAVPSGVDVGAADGLVLLVTGAAQAALHAHRVFHVPAEALERVTTEIRRVGVRPEAPNGAFATFATDLGTVRFDEGGTSPVDGVDGVRTAWNTTAPGAAPGDAVAVVPSGESEPRTDQAGAIAAELGGADVAATELRMSAGLPMPFQALTLLTPVPVGASRTGRVYVYQDFGEAWEIHVDDPALQVTFAADGTLEEPGVGDDIVAQLSAVDGRFVAIRLGTRDAPDAAAATRLGAVADALVEHGVLDASVPREVITLPEHARDLLDRDGVAVDDVVLLELGG